MLSSNWSQVSGHSRNLIQIFIVLLADTFWCPPLVAQYPIMSQVFSLFFFRTDCSRQDEQFSLVFTVASFLNNFLSLVNGYLFDRFGTMVTRLLGMWVHLIFLSPTTKPKENLKAAVENCHGHIVCPGFSWQTNGFSLTFLLCVLR